MSDEQLGHDLWLSRNGHGAGFFDRGYDEDVEKKLEDAARLLKGTDLYVGDDGKIHAMGVYGEGGSVVVDGSAAVGRAVEDPIVQ